MRKNLRAGRVTAALLAALYLIDPLAGILHAAHTEHRWCLVHGHVVHPGEGEPTSDGTGVFASGLQGRGGADECLAVVVVRDQSVSEPDGARFEALRRAHVADRAVQVAAAADVLARAPKQGPPAGRV